MNWIDILVLIPVIWFGVRGLKNGLIMEIASLVAIIGGGWFTVKYAPEIAAKFGGTLTVEIVTFIVLFFFILIAVHFIAIVISKIVKLVITDFVDRLLGLLFGVAKVLLVFGILFMFIFHVDQHSIVIKKETKAKSLFCRNVEPVVEKIYGNVINSSFLQKATERECQGGGE